MTTSCPPPSTSDGALAREEQARALCLRLLTARSRTRAELEGQLAKRGYPDDVSARVLDRLAALYPKGGDVGPEDLAAKGAVRAGELVKVLGSGEAVKGLRVRAHAFSATAREKITAAGGTVTEL